jgi:hypothetical protein
MTAVGVSALIYALLAVVLFLAARHLTAEAEGDAGRRSAGPVLAGLTASGLALLSPALLAQASTIMLELPATLLGALTVWAYAASLRAPDSKRRAWALGCVLTGFALTATQYAACWFLTAAAAEIAIDPAGRRRDALAWLRRTLRSRAILHPVLLLAAAAFALAAAIALTGGWKLPIGSKGFSMTRPGGPLVAGVLIAGAYLGWLLWRHREALRVHVPARYRILFVATILPLFLWYFVLYPPRLAVTLNWVAGPPAPIPRSSLAYWTFYPVYAVREGHVSMAAAVLVLATALLSWLRRDAPVEVRFLRWASVATALLVTAHHARQERFVLPFLPVWWLLAAETAAAGWMRLERPAARAGVAVAAAAAAGLLLGPPAARLYAAERLQGLAAGTFTTPAYEALLQRIVAEAAPSPSVRVFNALPGFSHHLIEWELRKDADLRSRRLDFELDHPLKSHGTDPEGPRKVFEAWLAKSPEEVVVAVEPIDLAARPPVPVAALGKHDAGWAEANLRLLRATDRYRMTGEWEFEATGFRVRAYRKVKSEERRE